MHGYIYLLHLARPLGNPRNPRAMAAHYTGWALDPEQRNAEHQAGRGAALTRAAVAAGIPWELFVLTEGDRALERRVKQLKAAGRLCPICGRRHPGGRLRIPQVRYEQLALDLEEDDFPLPPWPLQGPPDRFERAYLAAQRRQPPGRPQAVPEWFLDDLGIAF